MRFLGLGRPDGLKRATNLLSKEGHFYIIAILERVKRRHLSSSAKIY